MPGKYVTDNKYQIKEDPFTNQIEIIEKVGTRHYFIDKQSNSWRIWGANVAGDRGRPIKSRFENKPVEFDDKNQCITYCMKHLFV